MSAAHPNKSPMATSTCSALICFLMIVAAGACAETAAPFCETDVSLFSNDKCNYRLPSLLITKNGTVLAASQKRIGQGGDFSPSSRRVTLK